MLMTHLCVLVCTLTYGTPGMAAWIEMFGFFCFFVCFSSFRIPFLLTEPSVSHVHDVSSDPPPLSTAAGHRVDRTGSCGTRGQRLPLLYLQSQELWAFSGTQTSECDSIHQRQRLLLRTNRAAKINDEFWTPIVGQYRTSFFSQLTA